MLMFETFDAQFTSINVRNPSNTYDNTVRAMSQISHDESRLIGTLSRFPVVLNSAEDYSIEVQSGEGTASMASKMRFHLDMQVVRGTKISLHYPAGYRSIQLLANGEVQTPNEWNAATGMSNQLSKTQGCGEFRFVMAQ